MKIRQTIACALGTVILTSAPVHAETLDEIYNLAVLNDPQLGSAQAVFLSQNEVVAQNRARILPNVSLTGQTSDNRRIFPTNPAPPVSNFNDHNWAAVLNQPIFRLDTWYRFQQSKNIQAEAVANFAAEQQALLIRVSESYFAILNANSALSASNAERDAVKRQLEQVQQRFDVGLVAITDVLESQAAFDSSTVKVIESEGAQSTAFEPLFRLTGSNLREVNALVEDFPISYPDPQDEDAWVNTALQNNYSLIAARERLRSAERGLQIAKASHYPTIDAQASWRHNVSGSTNFLGRKIDQRTYALNINIPIYQGGGVRSNVRQAGYNLESAVKTFDLVEKQVAEATRTLYTRINTNVARVRARLRGIESSQSALDATQTGYEVGTRSIVDVLNAQQNLYLSQFSYASARYTYVIDTLLLKQSVGVLNPEDLYKLSRYLDNEVTISRNTPTTR